jgi:metal-responsive CopG/Arc/MetJ family transcriptional regulator
MTKRRISASIDPDLLSAAEAAVKRRGSSNFSAWMSEAIRRQLEHERRLAALGAFLAAFEASQGAITAEEIAEASRWARRTAVAPRRRRTGS